MAKKVGEDHAKEMFRRGLNELQAVFSFAGSNIAQPSIPSYYGNREPTPEITPPVPEVTPDRGPAIEHER
ncbi:hypothetical protein [Fimbriiglobus ruber]|uniref:Uncharacterized protein n=1 Tax=Fimbriiglobus ruber TaxID=1908690 RepID=A0A225DNA7_9BACT|nr:hypothetical protein [Fimbriiglobus ruber]OWK38946.1 hypothetical protein FRUB_06322 [Fimbriiglobus ruber]